MIYWQDKDKVSMRFSNMRKSRLESLEKCSILFKVKEEENFNHRNTFNISKIKI